MHFIVCGSRTLAPGHAGRYCCSLSCAVCKVANAFWRWVKFRPATLAELADYLPNEDELESRLADAAPQSVDLDTGNAVMAIAQNEHWLRLHGVAASACLAPHDAVARQLSIDTTETNLDGLRASLRCTSPNEAIELALALTQPRLLRIAAERVAEDPLLLGALSFCITVRSGSLEPCSIDQR